MRYVLLGVIAVVAIGGAALAEELTTVAVRYPFLCSGSLRDAVLVDLPDGVIAEAGTLKLGQQDVDSEMAKWPESVRTQMKRYPVYVLEKLVTRKLIAAEASDWAKQNGKSGSVETLVSAYLDANVKPPQVAVEEAKSFYAEHEKLFSGASWEQVENDVLAYVRDEQLMDARDAFTRAVSRRQAVRVSDSWVAAQHAKWAANPVEKARVSRKPTLAVFSVIGCCDKMHPVTEELRGNYADRLNVVFVHVGQEEILSELYGATSIPVEILFDAAGKEIFRKQGFMASTDIKAKFAECGVSLEERKTDG